MLEVLRALQKEAREATAASQAPRDWQEYRQWQQMWNPNWAPAAELDLFRSDP